MKTADSVRAILGSQTDDKTVVAQALLRVINAAADLNEKGEILTIALVERDNAPRIPQTLPNPGISDDRWEQLTRSHSDLVNGYLKMAFFKTSTAREFATELLRIIAFMPTEEEQTYALAKALFSPYVPYRQLPGTPVHMSDVTFRQKLASEKTRLELIEYIIGLPFGEYTEQASMLLQVLDDTADPEVRVALLAAAWRHHEARIVRAMKESSK